MKEIDWVEERVHVAERQYSRMQENLENGIIYQDEIVAAMTVINLAHQIALRKNRRDLLR